MNAPHLGFLRRSAFTLPALTRIRESLVYGFRNISLLKKKKRRKVENILKKQKEEYRKAGKEQIEERE